jgi:predicted SprT family Zn-dependent metalloprotease
MIQYERIKKLIDEVLNKIPADNMNKIHGEIIISKKLYQALGIWCELGQIYLVGTQLSFFDDLVIKYVIAHELAHDFLYRMNEKNGDFPYVDLQLVKWGFTEEILHYREIFHRKITQV